MCGKSDNGNVARRWIALESVDSFPAIENGHFEVHQDDIRTFGTDHLATLLAVCRRHDLEIAEQLEPHLEHIDIVFVVIDVMQFRHDAASISVPLETLTWLSCRMRSTRSAGLNRSLTSTDCTPKLNRLRSSASRSRDVMTMTGMSRHLVSFCKAATTAKPSISGIIRSSRIASGFSSCSRFSASRPLTASSTIHCGPSSHPRIPSRWTESSSTNRTRVGRAGA